MYLCFKSQKKIPQNIFCQILLWMNITQKHYPAINRLP